ncbi:MAG: Outer membrane efflux protein [candidate division TM6 bacterium GW2011_GWF2_28_16]|nr:MAG: Outer membrane efflux protein [candidate division TM6 bacterium GW2011_GWF2_28_16]
MKNKFLVIFIFFLINLININNKLNSQTLDIQEAVNLAYKNNPSLKALKFAISASQAGEKVAISGYLPQITLNSNEQFASSTKGPQNSTTINASQLIYSFSGPERLKRIAKTETEMAKLNEKNSQDLIRKDVEISFLQTWLLQEKQKTIKSLEVAAQQTIKKSENQDRVNLLGQNDVLIASANYASQMYNVYAYIDELSISQDQLEYLLGNSYKTDNNSPELVWDFNKNTTVNPLDNYYNLALKNRKELKLKDQEIAEYEEYQKYYKYNYLPEFSLTGQASRASQTIANNIGINLSWNLFDGASNYYQSQQYNANKLKALQEKESLFQQVKYDVQKAYHELMAYIKQLTAKDAAYKQADNEYNLAKLNYKIGLISKVDLDNSMYNFENAHFAWLTAKINVAIKESELNFACGYPK